MNKKERALLILSILQELFPNPEVPLHHKDPFTLLVAVLLSQQATDASVNKVTPALFQLADTPQKMASLKPREVEKIIRSIGLAPTKAKALVALSKILCEEHQGNVPATLEELEALPGVGHKTASVVLIQAFHIPAFPVDTHIFRAAHRWGLSKGKNVAQVEADLKNLFPEEIWETLHVQIILYCRKYCKAKGHIPENCPICSQLSLK